MTATRVVPARASRTREVIRFLSVGGVAFVVQIVLLNVLVSLGWPALPANALAIVASVAVAYVGNRQWSFSHRRRADAHREMLAFVVVNAVTLALSEAVLSAGYLLHIESDRLALNVMDVASIAMGTVLRYWAYRRFVFTAASASTPLPTPPLRADAFRE